MEKPFEGVTLLLLNFDINLMAILFWYILTLKVDKNLTPLSRKCGEKY